MKKIVIYQIKDITNTDYAFRMFNEKKFNFNDYKKVGGIETEKYDEYPDDDMLEMLFTASNLGKLKLPYAHSLSVSDVIVIDNKAYYCDLCGWKDVTDKI